MTAPWEADATPPVRTDRERRLALGLELLGAIIAGEIVRDLNATPESRESQGELLTPGEARSE